jgi:hypothetical protein
MGLSGRLRRSCRAKLLCPFGKPALLDLTEAANVCLSPGEGTEADDAQNCSRRFERLESAHTGTDRNANGTCLVRRKLAPHASIVSVLGFRSLS